MVVGGLEEPEQTTSIGRLPGDLFVGRTHELDELLAALAGAREGRGRLYLLMGDPGIGKTRLADELGSAATSTGAKVLWGRCWEGGGAPPYWPWVQIIQSHLATTSEPPEALLAGSPALRQLVTGLGEKQDCARTEGADGEAERFRLFDAVATLVRTASMERPLVLVIDDVHAADEPSLLLLQFLTYSLRESRVLIIVTYREADPRLKPGVRERIGEIARKGHSLLLRGLGKAEVAQFFRHAAGHHVADSIVQATWEKTSGNPFFVREVVGVLLAERRLERQRETQLSDLQVPLQVREAVHWHLRPLATEVLRLLEMVSVLGREFDLDVVERFAGLPGERLLDLFGSAAAAGVIRSVAGGPQRWAFVHGLMCETLYDDLAPALRPHLHGAAGRAIVQLRGSQLDAHLAAVAHHFIHAVPAIGPEPALEYQALAGDNAMQRFAFEAAAERYAQALRLLESQPHVDPHRQCTLLLALGKAQTCGVETRAARQTFQRAADLAQSIGLTEELAQAALGMADSGMGLPHSGGDTPRMRTVERALAALPNRDTSLRARLTSRLALEWSYTRPLAEREHLSQQAVDIARRLADPLTLAHTLSDRYAAVWTAANRAERVELAEEAIRLAGQLGDEQLTWRVRLWRMLNLVEMADALALDREVGDLARQAAQLQQPRYLWVITHMRAARAMSRGCFADAERLALEAFAHGERANDPSAADVYSSLMLPLRGLQGRLEELAAVMQAQAEHFPELLSMHSGLALVYSELGRLTEARVEFELLASGRFAAIHEGSLWTITLAYLAITCAALGDRARAAILYDLLCPYRERIAIMGHPVTWMDLPIAHFLGLLATTLQRWEAAEQHFLHSLEIEARLQARPYAARTQYEYAAMLLARSSRGDGNRARGLLEEACATAIELGMNALVAKAQALRSTLRLEEPGKQKEIALVDPDRAQPSREPVLVNERESLVRTDGQKDASSLAQGIFRQEGEFWTITYGERTCRLKHSRGLTFLAALLCEPGREIAATELASRVASNGTVDDSPDRPHPGPLLSGRGKNQTGKAHDASLRRGLGDAGELLDAEARVSYKRRLAELREELEEAQGFNDNGRAERLREEIELLTTELTRAVGLGGRERRAGSHAERARVNVTRAISLALAKISDSHPVLGKHLRRTIKTGTFCSYAPDPRAPSDWQT